MSGTRVLYHGSTDALEIRILLISAKGTFMTGASATKSFRMTERILEIFRPAGCLSRRDSIFMAVSPDQVVDAGGADDNVYEVEPQGPVECNHVGWYSAINVDLRTAFKYGARMDDIDIGEFAGLATGYWSGALCEQNPGEPWEYRARGARILRAVPTCEPDSRNGATRRP